MTARLGTMIKSSYCCVHWILVLGFLLSAVQLSRQQGPAIDVISVVHGKAVLPCDIVPPLNDDKVYLVLWFKDMSDIPMYSYDARGKPSAHAKHWSDEITLGQRAYFRTITEPASLSIDNVQESDEGLYRCRVDFQRSPTRNAKVNLTVIVPPQRPTIFDESGKELTALAGPYVEGSPMTLTCYASGGRPAPVVTWWRGGTLLRSESRAVAPSGTVQNKLEVGRLERDDLHAAFTCQAINNNISLPASNTVQVEVYYRPLEVSILGSNQPLSAGKEYELVCQAVGSRPPAQISWWKDGKQMDSVKKQVSSNGNISTSALKFSPVVKDYEKILVCRGENNRVEGSAMEDSWKLNVFFVPVLHLELGSKLNPDDIEESDDVYFECKINANPWVYKVVWKHDGQVVHHNASAGIIMSNQSLVLQKVRRQSAGNYTCLATNIEGEGASNAVELRILYKPFCKAEQKRFYGVARHEKAQVVCEVESYPPADSFRWAFNNSADSIDVPQARFSSSAASSSSVLTYMPMTEMDYGTVMCWATNMIGQQKEPCLFHIIAAGRPDPPLNCSVLNQTHESVEVDCLENFDGGLPQYFIMEVYDLHTHQLQLNVSNRFPVFSVNGLESGKGLKLAIYAANAKGRSEPAVDLEGFTLKVAEKITGDPASFEITPVLGILIGVVAALLLVAMAVIAALRLRMQRASNTGKPAILKGKGALGKPDGEDLYDVEEKNPDIIPHKKDADYQLVPESQKPFLNNQSDRRYDDVHKANNVTRNGDIHENYKNRRFPAHDVEEVTYAELSLGRASQPSSIPLRRDDPIIYAQIDHNRRAPPTEQTREIVTVRTPLISNQQESCV